MDPKGAALIREPHLFEARRLSEEIRYVLSDVRNLMNEKLKEKPTGENMFFFPVLFYYNHFRSIPFLSNCIIILPLLH